MDRRTFLKTTAAAGLGLYFFPQLGNIKAAAPKKKMIVLGIDGMDPHLTHIYLKKGLLPNLKRLIEFGSMMPMATSWPPQSPVAWSNIAVGAGTHVHGIYDFIHRDPADLVPYLSTSEVRPPSRILHLGGYTIPLSAGQTTLLRKGRPFWDYLAEHDIPTTLFKMPANFPCPEGDIDAVTGMGTPDMRGGYGSYTVFTSAPHRFSRDISGGQIQPVRFIDNRMDARLTGPENTFKQAEDNTHVPVIVWRDPSRNVARIKIQDNELVLNEGEWSGWLNLSFPLLGSFVSAKGICKIYLKRVYPDFFMYVSPINIDPSDPALPVVSSKKYAKSLTEGAGLFYTQGFPEDTKALSEGILREEEYLELARQIFSERKRLLDFEMNRFDRLDEGFLFFYFSSLDQNSHMYWRTIDQQHPLYTSELNQKYGNTLKSYYARVDHFIGDILNQYDMKDPDMTLVILSDHGFCPFRRQVNLNNWLFEKNYLSLESGKINKSKGFFSNVDWDRTGAYNLGINAIYINREGRDKFGSVPGGQATSLCRKIKTDLMKLIDPKTGQPAVSNVRMVSDTERLRYPFSPDLIVGWNVGYRTSWSSILGGFEDRVFSNNMDKWSGDHCVDPSFVPAVFISNKKVIKKAASLFDIAPSILSGFGIPKGKEMQGNSLI